MIDKTGTGRRTEAGSGPDPPMLRIGHHSHSFVVHHCARVVPPAVLDTKRTMTLGQHTGTPSEKRPHIVAVAELLFLVTEIE